MTNPKPNQPNAAGKAGSPDFVDLKQMTVKELFEKYRSTFLAWYEARGPKMDDLHKKLQAIEEEVTSRIQPNLPWS